MAVTKSQAKKLLASSPKKQGEDKRIATLSIVTRSKSGKTVTKEVIVQSDADFAILGKCYMKQLEKANATSPKKSPVSLSKKSPVKKVASPSSPIKGSSAVKRILSKNPEGLSKKQMLSLIESKDAISAYQLEKIIKSLIQKNQVKVAEKRGVTNIYVLVNPSPKSQPKKVATKKSPSSPIQGSSIIKDLLSKHPEGLSKKQILIPIEPKGTITLSQLDKILKYLTQKNQVKVAGKKGVHNIYVLVNPSPKSQSKKGYTKKSPPKEENFKRNIIEAILKSRAKKMTKAALLKATNIDNDMLEKLLDEMESDQDLGKVNKSYVVLNPNYGYMSPTDIETIIYEAELSPVPKSKKSKKKSLPIKGSPIRSPLTPAFTRSHVRDIEKIFGIFEENQDTTFTVQSLLQQARDEYEEIPQNVLDKIRTILEVLVKEGRVKEIKKKGKPVTYVIADEYRFDEKEE